MRVLTVWTSSFKLLPQYLSPTNLWDYISAHYTSNFLFTGFDNTYATTTDGRGSPIPRTGSPDRTRSRSTSPVRRTLSPSRAALDESASTAADLDPEAVRIALREYVTLMANTERERDDAIAQVRLLRDPRAGKQHSVELKCCVFLVKL